MAKLGLIGGTGPESTLIYYKKITNGYAQALHQDRFPELIIDSLSVFEVLRYTRQHDYDGLTDYLLKGINNLAAGGATFAALTGITPHIVFDRLQAKSPIPLVSMMATTVDHLQKHHYRQVLLLGTYPTMHEGFFRNDLAKHGIKVAVPTDEEQDQVNTLIEKELEYGIVSTAAKNKLHNLCSYYQKHNQVDAVILGCTELPLAFDQLALAIPTVDVMAVHIRALVKQLLKTE